MCFLNCLFLRLRVVACWFDDFACLIACFLCCLFEWFYKQVFSTARELADMLRVELVVGTRPSALPNIGKHNACTFSGFLF